MVASEVVAQLNKLIAAYGDLHVVVGVERNGYGEEVTDIMPTAKQECVDINNVHLQVFDLQLREFCLVAKGRW